MKLPPRSLLLLPLAILTLFNCEAIFDIYPPKIEIIEPQEGVSYFGTLPVELQVTDNRKVEKVELFLDDASVHEFSREPYKTEINLVGISAKALKVVAYDRVGNWSDSERRTSLIEESVSTTDIPNGSSSGYIDISYTYSTGGSISNAGHNIEYRFDWGDDSYSIWSSSTTDSHSWSSAGIYQVKAQARCATHTNVVSNWSSSKTVTTQITETVSTPGSPTGPSSCIRGTSYSYSIGGARSNLGHSIQYRFYFVVSESHIYTDWSSSASFSHIWLSSGSAGIVQGQARCATHTSVVSSWSSSLLVHFTNQ